MREVLCVCVCVCDGEQYTTEYTLTVSLNTYRAGSRFIRGDVNYTKARQRVNELERRGFPASIEKREGECVYVCGCARA